MYCSDVLGMTACAAIPRKDKPKSSMITRRWHESSTELRAAWHTVAAAIRGAPLQLQICPYLLKSGCITAGHQRHVAAVCGSLPLCLTLLPQGRKLLRSHRLLMQLHASRPGHVMERL